MSNATSAKPANVINANAPLKGLLAVYAAAQGAIVAENVLRDAIKACMAKEDMKAIKREVYIARTGHTLKLTREATILVLNMGGHKKDGDNDGRRTHKQEQAYTAARVWMTSFLDRHGFDTKAAPIASKPDTTMMDIDKLKAPSKPKINNAPDLAAFCDAHAAYGYDLFLVNKGHSAVNTDMGSELMGAFADHLAAVREIIKKHQG